MVDVKTLELLAEQMRQDVKRGGGLSYSAVMSIAAIIDAAIGAPVMWPSHVAGADFADEYYRGSNHGRAAFNHGVKWAVERYGPSEVIKIREHK